jgi:thiol:disulfide interchange protein DsbD
MALALTIVSFLVLGPIVGTLLVEAASKGNHLIGCSVFIGISFTIYAFRYVPRMVEFIKSGGWLNTVKVVLGFLELALAFKFLSNADLVLQLHLLEESVLAIWIAIFGLAFTYLVKLHYRMIVR